MTLAYADVIRCATMILAGGRQPPSAGNPQCGSVELAQSKGVAPLWVLMQRRAGSMAAQQAASQAMLQALTVWK